MVPRALAVQALHTHSRGTCPGIVVVEQTSSTQLKDEEVNEVFERAGLIAYAYPVSLL